MIIVAGKKRGNETKEIAALKCLQTKVLSIFLVFSGEYCLFSVGGIAVEGSHAIEEDQVGTAFPERPIRARNCRTNHLFFGCCWPGKSQQPLDTRTDFHTKKQNDIC